MASFNIEVDGKEYEIEFTRDSVRKFEQAGGTLQNLRTQIQTTVDRLFVIGIMTDNSLINPNLAAKILEKALDEYGLAEVYATLVDPFMEVFTQGGQDVKKHMRVSPQKSNG